MDDRSSGWAAGSRGRAPNEEFDPCNLDRFEDWPILAAMAVIAALAPPATAQAGVTLNYSAATTDGGSYTSGAFTTFISDTQTVGGITLGLQSFSTQTASLGTLSTTTFTLSNLTSGTDSITIKIAAQGYTLPTSTSLLTSAASGSSAIYTSGSTASLQSYAAAGNAGLGTIFSGTTTGAHGGTITGAGNVATAYVFTPSSASTGFVSSGGYSIGQMLTISLGAGDTATLTLNSNVQAAVVPEPATVAMALTALPLLGFGAWARRHRARA